NAVPLPTANGECVIGGPAGPALLYRLPVGKGQLVYVGWEIAASLPDGRKPSTPEQEQTFEEQVRILQNIVAEKYSETTGAGTDQEKLFVATPLTQEKAFTPGIEGPACDAKGNIFAVNFQKQQTIGKVTPDGKGEVFVELPDKSTGNGIVFDRRGIMYVADYVGHNVLRIDPATRQVTVFAHNDQMHQPNDLAITPDGTLYASDPDWKNGTGQIWRIDREGNTSRVAAGMGTTNGIEVSPDGQTLYVNESVQRNIWAFAIGKDGSLSDKRLLKKFDDHGFDGMRCDVDGNLYITRYGKGTVVVLSPK